MNAITASGGAQSDKVPLTKKLPIWFMGASGLSGSALTRTNSNTSVSKEGVKAKPFSFGKSLNDTVNVTVSPMFTLVADGITVTEGSVSSAYTGTIIHIIIMTARINDIILFIMLSPFYVLNSNCSFLRCNYYSILYIFMITHKKGKVN